MKLCKNIANYAKLYKIKQLLRATKNKENLHLLRRGDAHEVQGVF